MFINYYSILGRALCILMLWALTCPQSFAQSAVEEKKTERSPILPTPNELLDAKISALNKSLLELDALTVLAQKSLAKEQGLEKKFLDTHAFLSLSIKNTAPKDLYRLISTQVYFDKAKKPLAQGGVHNGGLPRKSELFFGAIEPGCHEIKVKARFERLTRKDNKFVVKRIEEIEKVQAFNAPSGYRIEIDIEGFETHNTWVNLYRGPDVRFNNSARPNFVVGAPLISLDDVLKQGRLEVNYITEDMSDHRLAKKSISIDGLPVLSEAKQEEKDGTAIFNAPLAPGKHRLNVTLIFTQNKWVTGGPSYNFKLNFEQDFYVISGQTTVVELAGMPKGGIKSALSDTRYARSTTRILSKDFPEFFMARCPQDEAVVKPVAEEKVAPKVLEKTESKAEEKSEPMPEEKTEPKAEEKTEPKALETKPEAEIKEPSLEKTPEGHKPETGE